MLSECEPGKQPLCAPLTIKGVISSRGTEPGANQRAGKAATATSQAADGGDLSPAAAADRDRPLGTSMEDHFGQEKKRGEKSGMSKHVILMRQQAKRHNYEIMNRNI